mmetsp:Transcript_12539/g.18937  ORF Transcript_12539/g.18937 Transcript_12539/m.18937 type:complete len:233 (+) Transcript_12539:145-843(+)|eukprot:CAMPEP_0185018310 /NCGR_PEP_ID=MMETSP1103-20130426/1074_1 /TAXON_ID=36769 /ORGANISM="Paraphysomonas bandaiensis, Strain Caron Lab Isolate" /LENGTH=232 /DNA_ID=CAMNT_0027548075 /DNA_START=145 /DNA_END=843 /DNA_ORIENTATION=+
MGCGASSSGNSSGDQMVVNTRPVNVAPVREVEAITLEELQSQRIEFWESRVDGNRDMWNALRMASDAFLADDTALATAILDASNINLPNGTLEQCFDERGHEYKVPTFCYTTPSNIGTGAKAMDTTADSLIKKNVVGRPTLLKVRINPGDHNLSIDTDTSISIAELKRLIHEASLVANEKDAHFKICPEKRQRIFFLGKEMKNNQQVLEDLGFDDTRVVQIFLRQEPSADKV